MRRIVFFVLPQALLIPLGFALGLFFGVVETLGGWTQALNHVSDGSWGPGAGHMSAPGLVIIAAVFALLVLGFVSSLTFAGLQAGLMGALYGGVCACLIEGIWLTCRKVPATDVRIIKRWAGYGAFAVTLFCLWVAMFNPIRDVLGIFAVTGTFVCLAFGAGGFVRWLIARRRA